jgi:hypothetical protein
VKGIGNLSNWTRPTATNFALQHTSGCKEEEETTTMSRITRWWLLLAAGLPSQASATVYSSLLLNEDNAIAENGRELVDRSYRYYNTDLNCVVGHDESDDTLKFFPFEFWYAVEADTPDMNFLRPLESKMFKSVSSHVFWCYGKYATMDFGGRRLSDGEISQREQEIRLARKLGVVSVSSGGYDSATERKYLL